jgi:hypothetical protein
LVFDSPANHPATKPREVRCTDGDPTCDGDGSVNGVCGIEVVVCANSTFDSGCTLFGTQSVTVDHALDNGDPKFDPDFQALQNRIDSEIELPNTTPDECTTPTVFLVPIKGPIGNDKCKKSRKRLGITTLSQVIDGKISTDKDRLNLTCVPAAGGCDPTSLFAGTFDRIQRQIFNQNCALSGCHDSQSQSAGLLLETGAAYANLVNATPTTGGAIAAGWLRVDAPSPGVAGNPDSSLLYHKVEGDLPDASFGERMPLSKPRLHKTLRDVIRLWIEAGAPETGWVAGTD